MKKSNYFFCYNKNVSDYLFTKDVHYITVAKDVKTQKIFSLFEINEKFQKAMDEYKALKK